MGFSPLPLTKMREAASCLGKEKHDRATANMIARKSKSAKRLSTYECRYCGYWHIGEKLCSITKKK